MKRLSVSLLLLVAVSAGLRAQMGWYAPSLPFTYVVNTIFFRDASTGWMGGGFSDGASLIKKTTDGGVTWVSQTTPEGSGGISRIVFVTKNLGFASGDAGMILKTTDGGETWIRKPTDTNQLLRSIFFINDQVGWACGNTVILMTKDGGETWSSRSLPGIAIWDIAFKNANEGWAIGVYENAFKTTDGGESWQAIPPPMPGRSMFSIQFLSERLGFIAGGDQVIRTTDGGATWTTVYKSDGTQMNTVFFADSLVGWAGGNGILNTTDGGRTWHEQALPPGANSFIVLHATSRKDAWAAGWSTLLKTTSGGALTAVGQQEEEGASAPREFSLAQNYPNPFNPSTRIAFSLPVRSFVTLKVFDVMGRCVSTLVDDERAAGLHACEWNASGFPSGVYFCRLEAGGRTAATRLALVK